MYLGGAWPSSGQGLRGVPPPGSVTCLRSRGACLLSTGVEHLLGSSPDCRESKLRHLVPG